MTSYEIDNVIAELMEEGFDLNVVNQVNKCLNNGFDEMKGVSINATAQDIRLINEIYTKLYKDCTNETDLSHVQKIFVELINNNLPLEHFITKWHSCAMLTMMLEDLKEGLDIKHYMNIGSADDYNANKISALRFLLKENVFDGLTEDQIFALKSISYQYNDASIVISAKREGIIDDFIHYLKLRRNDVPDAHATAKFKASYPEWIDLAENSSVEYIEKFKFLLEDEIKTQRLKTIKDYIKKFNIEDLKTIVNTEITEDVMDILKLKNEPHVIVDIITNNDKYNMELINLLNDYGKYLSTYDLKQLTKMLNEIDLEKGLEAIEEEIKNNPEVICRDLIEILSGIKSNIDISYYLTEEDQKYPFDYTAKRYIRLILEYNKKHEDNPIDLNNIFDDYNKGENLIDNDNIEELINVLEKDINITPFLEADCDTIDTLIYNYEKYNFSQEQLDLLLAYEKFEPSEENYEFLMDIVSNDYQIMNQEDIFRQSVKIYKELAKLAEYDEFSKKILDEKLTEENCMLLVSCLKQYQKASGIFKEICKYNLSHGNLFALNENLGQTMSEEKLDIIYRDLIDGINPSKYASDSFSVEQLKIFSEINKIISSVETEYTRNELTRSLNKIYNPDFSVEQLEYIKERIKKEKTVSHFEPEYNLRQMKLYDKWRDAFYIYNFDLYHKSENANDILCKVIRKEYSKLDKTLPVEEQEKIFKNIQKETLTQIAENEELELDMDTKIFIYKIIENLDEKAKEQKNIER